MHSRRGRPTLRVLQQDLVTDWENPYPQRCLRESRLHDLHPLSNLPHPIIAKAGVAFGSDPTEDNFVGPVASSSAINLSEIKVMQWRGGVWRDPDTGVHWLVAAGLAKGNHEDHDDFYMRVKRADASGAIRTWLPTPEDHRLLKRETASRILTEWELEIQARMLDALREAQLGGSTRFSIAHPVTAAQLCDVVLEVTPVRHADSIAVEEIGIELLPAPGCSGSQLVWQATVRLLISASPPEQGWDRFQDLYSNMGEPGSLTNRIADLEALAAAGELAESKPGHSAHYTHTRHLADCSVKGRAVRALCGAFFVPTQDHQRLDPCPICTDRLNSLPG